MSAIRKISGTITRPSDTTAYAAGDLVANSTTAGSVTPVTFAFGAPAHRLSLRNLTIRKSQASITNANFRLWLLDASPTVTNGDNGAIAGTWLSTAICEPIQVDVIALLTGGGAIGSSVFTEDMIILPGTIYALLEATAAYTPASAEVFTLEMTALER